MKIGLRFALVNAHPLSAGRPRVALSIYESPADDVKGNPRFRVKLHNQSRRSFNQDSLNALTSIISFLVYARSAVLQMISETKSKPAKVNFDDKAKRKEPAEETFDSLQSQAEKFPREGARIQTICNRGGLVACHRRGYGHSPGDSRKRLRFQELSFATYPWSKNQKSYQIVSNSAGLD